MADQTDFVEDNDNHGGDDEALSSLLLLLKAKGHDDEPDSDEVYNFRVNEMLEFFILSS